MSERASRWARDLTTSPTGAPLTGQEAHLLLILASYHSEIMGAGYWPTVKQLATMLRLQDRRTQWLLTELEKKGCISRDSRGGRGHATEYTLPLPVKGAVSEEQTDIKGAMGAVQTAPIGAEKGAVSDNGARERVQSDDVKGAVFDTERVQSAVPDGEPKGGETLGVPRSTSSLSFPSVTTERERAPEPAKPKKQRKRDAAWDSTPSVSEEFTTAMVAKHTKDLGEERTRFEIRRALTHQQAKKYNPCDLYVENWLRGEVEKLAARGAPSYRNGHKPEADEFDEAKEKEPRTVGVNYFPPARDGP